MRHKKLALTAGLLMCSAAVAMKTLPVMAEVVTTTPNAVTAAPATPALAPAPAVAAGTLPELTTLIKQNSAAVVNVSIEGKASSAEAELPEDLQLPPELKRFFRGLPDAQPDNRTIKGMGSGFIMSADGYIVTNAHVVEEATSVTVGLSDKRELPAEVVGLDKLSDIALLKVKADNLPVVQLGDSDGLQVGQWVVAIGAPFGLDHSATQGIVSALSRSLPDGTYVPFIQTDVAVNPGNSGGPLFDLGGRVVGVNSQIYSRSGGYMGISFSIPINVAKTVVEQLKTKGQVSRGWLGVEIQDMDQKLANSFNLKQPNGALVASVMPGSPADKAGVQAGDIIINFGNSAVNAAADLPLLVGNTPVGTKVATKVLRAGTEKMLDITVDQLASKDDGKTSSFAATNDSTSLGIAVATPTEVERKANSLTDKGVIVRKVLPGSSAEQAGLAVDDVIISVNNTAVRSAEELKSIVKAAPEDKPLAMLVVNGDKTRFIAVTKNKP